MSYNLNYFHRNEYESLTSSLFISSGEEGIEILILMANCKTIYFDASLITGCYIKLNLVYLNPDTFLLTNWSNTMSNINGKTPNAFCIAKREPAYVRQTTVEEKRDSSGKIIAQIIHFPEATWQDTNRGELGKSNSLRFTRFKPVELPSVDTSVPVKPR